MFKTFQNCARLFSAGKSRLVANTVPRGIVSMGHWQPTVGFAGLAKSSSGKVEAAFPSIGQIQARSFQTLQPRFRKYKKAQKGRVPVRTGGSTKGNYLAFGNYGLRVKDGCRLRAKILTSIYASVRRKIKSAKDSKIYLRVFPDIPVSSKGSEARMGKGKGTFEYYAARVPKDKILFELGGPNLGVELAKEAFRLASHKLPVDTEFVVLSEKTKQPKVFPPTTVPFVQAR
ncbi:54S ribosomal protein L16, mitochondrial [Smittium mucronatum]|uniref:54S ribosomal protein L16, mitochondrial n=1 Tax=Smittium mucronatum TaxID=133383 RepID=A0A1R0GNP6_9FUNG|nr:54S ribosomal protein L16, mitochondrial [Smittium mucronatum]